MLNNDIDLILMDIDLGANKIDGIEAVRKIREEKEIPVIFLTSHSKSDYKHRIEDVSEHEYISKNSGDIVLFDAMKRFLY